MLNFIVPPWVRFAAIVALSASCIGYGYVKGAESKENDYNRAALKQMEANQIEAVRKARLTHQRELTYETEIRRLYSLPRQVVHDRVTTYLTSLCNTSGGELPSVAQGSGLSDYGADADAAIRRVDLVSNVLAAQHNKAQLMECRGWVIDHGFAQ